MVIAYEAENRLDRAATVLANEVKASPDSDSAVSLLAGTSLMLGRYDQALTFYQQLLQKNPKSADLHRLIGAAYHGKHDDAQAIANFQEAVKLAPQDAAAVAGLADLLRMAGRASEAGASYRRVLQLAPASATAMNNLAYLQVVVNEDLDEAGHLIQHALELIPEEPDFTDTLGLIYTGKLANIVVL